MAERTGPGLPRAAQRLACLRVPGGRREDASEGRRRALADPEEPQPKGVDLVTVLYILGGIPAIVGFVLILFFLVNLFPGIPA